MAFERVWDSATPAGTAPANTVATELRGLEKAVEERLNSLLGITDWSTQSDPIKGIRLLLTAAAASYIAGGTASFAIKNNANTANNLLIEDDGDATLRKDLSILGKIVAALTIDHDVTIEDGHAFLIQSRVTIDGAQSSSVPVDKGSVTGNVTIDWNEGNNQVLEAIGNLTFTFNNPRPGAFYTLSIKQDGVGSRLVTGYPGDVRWPDAGPPPALTTTASRTDVITFFYNGTVYQGAMFATGYA